MATTNKKLSELEAVQQVHGALESFDAQGRARILRSVTSLLEVSAFGGQSNDPASAAQAVSSSTSQAQAGDGTIPQQMRIDTFVASKRPTTTYQRLACLAYYLEHHDQTTELSGKDLTKANAAARQPKISNVTVFLSDATTKYGFFAAVGGGKKTLTSRGAAMVGALPDQAAVKQTLQEHPAPRRSGRRPKAKSTKSK